MLQTGVPYFDLSLQHVSRPLLAGMRRWGDGERFLRRIADIRAAEPEATFRSSFILGYPGETERDHDLLLEFLAAAQLDWAGFFPFSNEEGTHAAGLADQVPPSWRSSDCASAPSCRTRSPRPGATRLSASAGRCSSTRPGGAGRCTRRPRSTASCTCPTDLVVGSLVDVRITGAEGPDLSRRPGQRRDPVGGAPPAQRAAPERRERRHPRAPAARRSPSGPSALATPANAVTVARLLAAPVYVLMLVAWGASWINVVVGFVLAGQRRARRLHGPPPGHDPLGRLPRPAGRQGRASSARSSRWPPRDTCPGCPSC